jgi:AcrR family transcriptional regulator
LVAEGRRDRKSREVRRAEILDAAARLFIAHGVGGVSIADIAGAAGVAKGLLYHYFDSKDELLGALRDRYLKDWYEEIEQLLTKPKSGDEARSFERFLRSMYEFHADKVELHELLMASEGSEDEITENVRKLLLEFIRAGVKRKAFEVASLDLTVDFLLNGLHGLLVKYLHEGRSAKRFTDDAMTMARPLMGM